MSTLFFTICAQNYIGLSKVAGASVARHAPDADFRIYVADGLERDDAFPDLKGTILSAPEALSRTINPAEYANMAFMYNITEFCTALKAAAFIDGFAAGYDQVVYIDPDIFVTADFTPVMDALASSAIVMTPHLVIPSLGEGPRSDHGILATGIYNLGFLALRRSDECAAFLRWWHERLRFQAFNDHYHSLFTDQKWMDFVPALFSSEAVHVLRHLGCNVAPWNFHERAVAIDGDGFTVTPRAEGAQVGPVPLVFLHFSGFDFRKIVDGEFDQRNLIELKGFKDFEPVYAAYGRAIQAFAEDMKRYLALPYGYGTFADGSPVLPSHRRLFRVWRQRHGNAAAPFATGKGTFHAALAAKGLQGSGSPADARAEKTTLRGLANPQGLMRKAHAGFRLLYRVMGRARFMFFIRSLNRLSNIEQHYDTFVIDGSAVITAGSHDITGAG